jgi:hypothetical protein
VALEDDRPYWERHYGIVRGEPNRRAWRRLGVAFVAAVVIVVAVVVIGSLVTA